MKYKTNPITSKFRSIKYPFFALKKAPVELVYSLDKIHIKKDFKGHLELLDNKQLSGDYFSRLLQIDKRVTFDFTCKDLQDLIFCKARWGMDKNAIPHNLATIERYYTKVVKVRKIIDKLLWVKGISYPFNLSILSTIELTDDLYVIMVNINNEWFIKEFTYEPKTIKKFAIL